jgi:hypothetical protein
MNQYTYTSLVKDCVENLSKCSGLNEVFYTNLNYIRIANSKFRTEQQYSYSYPRHDMSMCELHRQEIIDYCEIAKIKPYFKEICNATHKSKLYVRYYKDGIDITRVINI